MRSRWSTPFPIIVLYGSIASVVVPKPKDLGSSSSGILPHDVHTKPCGPGDKEASIEIIFPRANQTLDIRTDFSIGRNLLVRAHIKNFRLRFDGQALFSVASDASNAKAQNWRDHDDGNYRMDIITTNPNIELFGLGQGLYAISAFLVDNDYKARSCWRSHRVVFRVGHVNVENRSEALLLGLDRMLGAGGRMTAADKPWLLQPQSHKDFAYVTVLWSNDYIDTVLAWAAGLDAVKSTFGRVCMIVQEWIGEILVDYLERCCCEVVSVEPIQSPVAGGDSRYQFALTKLRVLQLGRAGYRKIVLMDSDILVLQNIDELFWFPAPAATVSAATLLGSTNAPKLSTGVMVLEPSEEEFQAVMRRVKDWEASDGASLRFIEQDILDMHWTSEGRIKYHVLPMIYNLYPELLDTLPFLASESQQIETSLGEGMWEKYPIDHGVKLVHFWHWYNPVAALADSMKAGLQGQARMKHKQMWRWYDLWWDLHQKALKAAIPNKYEGWLDGCKRWAIKRHFGDSGNFLPTALGQCAHRQSGLEW